MKPMKIFFASAVLLSAAFYSSAQAPESREARLKNHVCTLASDDMKGRRAGSEDAARAREYIAGQFRAMGLEPFGTDGYEMRFSHSGGEYCDLVGIIPGSDPALKDEYIVLGAHYDHLGVRHGEVFNGADDNASGTAAVIEIARELMKDPGALGRSVVLAAFDAEELGLFGSKALCKTLADSLGTERIKLMMSIDMVGWYGTSGWLKMSGYATVKDGHKLLCEEAVSAGINLKLKKFETSIFTATDTEAFAQEGIPTLAVTTGLKSPYHKPGDDPGLIDYAGLDKVTAYIAGLTGKVASDPELASSGKVAAKHSDRLPAFEVGVKGSLTVSNCSFKTAKLQTFGEYGWNGGLSLQYNHKAFALRVDALYERNRSPFPVSENVFGGSAVYRQQALTVPVLFMLQDHEGPVRTYVGLGGYYSRVMDWSCTKPLPAELKPDQFGWDFALGTRMGHIDLAVEFRNQIGSMFAGDGELKGAFNSGSISIGYYF